MQLLVAAGVIYGNCCFDFDWFAIEQERRVDILLHCRDGGPGEIVSRRTYDLDVSDVAFF